MSQSSACPLWVHSAADLNELVHLLLEPARTHPVAVVSIHHRQDRPWIDSDSLAEALAGLVPVYVLPADLAWDLSAALPARTAVFGGAGRVYPIGQAWNDDPHQSPLRLVRSPDEAAAVTEMLVNDGLRMLGSRSATTYVAPQRGATGFVVGLVGTSRGVVRLEDGSLATVWPELVDSGLTAGQLLQPGQQVAGLLDTASRRLDVSGAVPDPAAALTKYHPGEVVLAQVRNVTPETLELAVHPKVTTVVARADVTTNDHDDLRELFTAGQTVLARVRHLDGCLVRLGLDDIDDDESAVPALTLLAGGPAWLTSPDQPIPAPAVDKQLPRVGAARTHAPCPVVVDAPAVPVSTVAPGSPPVALEVPAPDTTETLDALQQQVRWLTGERQRLLEQVSAQRQHLARKWTARAKANPSQGASPAQEAYPVAFDDPLEQLRFEVYLEWATRIAPSQKSELPLASWSVGPDFLASVADTHGLSRRTLVRVLVEVLTGLAEQVPGRDLHYLRTGAGPGEPAVQRADGAICWRVALQQAAAAARRLHYWKRGEHIELSRVVVHDDMRP